MVVWLLWEAVSMVMKTVKPRLLYDLFKLLCLMERNKSVLHINKLHLKFKLNITFIKYYKCLSAYKLTLWCEYFVLVSVFLWLTGITRSKQTLKFFFWLNVSFFRATRVSPMNSLCLNVSSSLTESLKTNKFLWTLQYRVRERWAQSRSYRRVLRDISSSVMPW